MRFVFCGRLVPDAFTEPSHRDGLQWTPGNRLTEAAYNSETAYNGRLGAASQRWPTIQPSDTDGLHDYKTSARRGGWAGAEGHQWVG